MDRFIEMLHQHEKSEDPRIRGIAENFNYIDKLAPNFTIFQVKQCLFMHNFKAYQISEDTNMLVATHEFGQALDVELEKVYERLMITKEKETQEKTQDSMEQIKSVVTCSRQGEIDNIHSLEQIELRREESRGEKDE